MVKIPMAKLETDVAMVRAIDPTNALLPACDSLVTRAAKWEADAQSALQGKVPEDFTLKNVTTFLGLVKQNQKALKPFLSGRKK